MEDGERAVGIVVDPHLGLDEVVSVGVLRDLQTETALAHAVVVAHGARLVDAQDVAPGAGAISDEGRAGVLGGDREARVVRRQIDLGEIPVGLFHRRHAGHPQFLGQTALQRASPEGSILHADQGSMFNAD